MSKNIRKNQKIKKGICCASIKDIINLQLGEKALASRKGHRIESNTMAIVNITDIVSPALVKLGEAIYSGSSQHRYGKFRVQFVLAFSLGKSIEEYSKKVDISKLIRLKQNIFPSYSYQCQPLYPCRVEDKLLYQIMKEWTTKTNLEQEIEKQKNNVKILTKNKED